MQNQYPPTAPEDLFPIHIICPCDFCSPPPPPPVSKLLLDSFLVYIPLSLFFCILFPFVPFYYPLSAIIIFILVPLATFTLRYKDTRRRRL